MITSLEAEATLVLNGQHCQRDTEQGFDRETGAGWGAANYQTAEKKARLYLPHGSQLRRNLRRLPNPRRAGSCAGPLRPAAPAEIKDPWLLEEAQDEGFLGV